MNGKIYWTMLVSIVSPNLIFCISIIVEFEILKSIYLIYLKIRFYTRTWYSNNSYLFYHFYLRRFYNRPFEVALKIMNKSHLTRLTNSFIICESPSSKKFWTLCDVIIKANVKQKANTGSTGPSFSRIAMYYD